MRKYAIVGVLLLVLVLAACGDEQPPTQIYIVLSPTPVADAAGSTTEDTSVNSPTTPELSATNTDTPALTATTPATATTQPTNTSAPTAPQVIPSATPAPNLFPTPTTAQVPAAEEVFQNGRMFWIRHNRQIWVMVSTNEDQRSGDWYCYNDTFEDGEPEIDPNLIPPEGMYQPRRGFGKLWRNHPDLREALGWATTPEFELTSDYTYIPGGYVQDGKYYPGPGEHRLTTLYHQTISFFEGEIRGDCQGGTWRMAPDQ